MSSKTRYIFSEGNLSINKETIEIPKIALITILGEGANGVVFKGHHSYLDRDVAVKIWLPRKGFDYPDKDRFLAEIRKISNLKRSQIIQIYDADVINGNYCYAVLELIDGISLEEWLMDSNEFTKRREIVKTISEELIYLHKNDIFHGDLHCKNIMIKDSGELVLLDFGTSIFCNDGKPHEREKKLFLETVEKILPEMKEYQFLDIYSLKKFPTECSPYAIRALCQFFSFFGDYYDESIDDFDRSNLVISSSIVIAEVPFFNIQKIINFFKSIDVEPDYLVNFVSMSYTHIKMNLDNLEERKIEYLGISEDDIATFSKIYLLWRAKFNNLAVFDQIEL